MKEILCDIIQTRSPVVEEDETPPCQEETTNEEVDNS
jgi:hypothetical protein